MGEILVCEFHGLAIIHFLYEFLIAASNVVVLCLAFSCCEGGGNNAIGVIIQLLLAKPSFYSS